MISKFFPAGQLILILIFIIYFPIDSVKYVSRFMLRYLKGLQTYFHLTVKQIYLT